MTTNRLNISFYFLSDTIQSPSDTPAGSKWYVYTTFTYQCVESPVFLVLFPMRKNPILLTDTPHTPHISPPVATYNSLRSTGGEIPNRFLSSEDGYIWHKLSFCINPVKIVPKWVLEHLEQVAEKLKMGYNGLRASVKKHEVLYG